jgi:hypothetical protein
MVLLLKVIFDRLYPAKNIAKCWNLYLLRVLIYDFKIISLLGRVQNQYRKLRQFVIEIHPPSKPEILLVQNLFVVMKTICCCGFFTRSTYVSLFPFKGFVF